MKYWIWLSKIIRVSLKKKLRLLSLYNMNVEKIYNLNRTVLEDLKFLTKENVDNLLDYTKRENLEEEILFLFNNNIKVISIIDKDYPTCLKEIYDSPIVLYTKGNLNLLKNKKVAIVGARDCSNYGAFVAEKVAKKLAKKNISIISGIAKGIDYYSHMGSLKEIGSTIGVIGTGIDIVYLEENKVLYEKILKNNGLIITEYPIGTKPLKYNFPARNRIISCLSNILIVVEAKEKSGTLITVDFALEHGKDIYVVPGNITSLTSKGTNNLIKQGANIFLNTDEIIDELNID